MKTFNRNFITLVLDKRENSEVKNIQIPGKILVCIVGKQSFLIVDCY